MQSVGLPARASQEPWGATARVPNEIILQQVVEDACDPWVGACVVAPDPTAMQGAVEYLCAVLEQGRYIASAVQDANLPFCDQAGPQLRHVLEHVEQFLHGIDAGQIDYDSRARDRTIEADPIVANRRFSEAMSALRDRCSQPWPSSVIVRADGGLDGSLKFHTSSTPLRELLFLASHAIHHYAIVRVVLLQLGLTLPDPIGVAPATVRYRLECAA